jgi:putative peptidoglycan lipid II flippase
VALVPHARSGVFPPEPGWAEFLLKLAVALYLMGGVIWYGMGSEASWFEITTSARAVKLTLVIARRAAAYFASLALMGFRLRDFVRHERRP